MSAYPHESSSDTALPITAGDFATLPEHLLDTLFELHARHGEIAALEDRGNRIIFVFGPEVIRQVFTDGRRFHAHFAPVRGPRASAQRRLSSGLLSMNGEKHKQHRRRVIEPFQRTAIAGYHAALVKLTQELIDSWQPGQIIDMHEEMIQFMLRVTSTMLFGFEEAELAYDVGRHIDRWMNMHQELGIASLMTDDRSDGEYEALLAYAGEVERRVREMIDHRRQHNTGGHDVLSILLRSHDDEQAFSDDELVGHTTALFGAAHLTTARTLCWTLFLLAQHPSIHRDLVAAAELVHQGELPKEENLDAEPMVERVIKESMRLLSASAYSHRICAEATQLGPFSVGPGTPIVFSPLAAHRNATLYPEPDRFVPDRWLTLSPSPYEYLPFGAGPRMCLGGPLAKMILKIALPMITTRYRLQVVPHTQIEPQVRTTMLTPTLPIWMQANPAGDEDFVANPVHGSITRLVRLPSPHRIASLRPASPQLPTSGIVLGSDAGTLGGPTAEGRA